MGLKYKKILVAIDGSQEADWAFEKAINIAKEDNAKVLLAHVIEKIGFGSFEGLDQTIINTTERFAFDMLEIYKKVAIDAGVSEVDYLLEYGSPKNIIPKDTAKQTNCDLIVCGASGLNAVERIFLGSVSENIARYAPCDVLIVRTGIKKEQQKSD
jgi:nucleotide-binding universal stress UspA family protein